MKQMIILKIIIINKKHINLIKAIFINNNETIHINKKINWIKMKIFKMAIIIKILNNNNNSLKINLIKKFRKTIFRVI